MSNSKYETVIGLEIHAELNTKSKLFCNCEVAFGTDANTLTCPICLGMPGVLPVLNERAFEFSLRAAAAMNCEISPACAFDRKNYFYPDLPKGYQISQKYAPLARNGYVDFEFEGETHRTRIHQIHLEEDAGKLVHADVTGNANRSYVDLNRACVPLLEIVSEPDLRSPDEAIAYWRAVKEILEYIDISDCNMEEGSFRCDANISLRPIGSQAFGTRTELKNKNSFQHVLAALKYEERRQARILDEGGEIHQETLLYDLDTGRTSPMRSKEEAHDYRYFPEPDLVRANVSSEREEEIRSALPELPADRRARFIDEYQIPDYDAEFLTATRQMADFFDETARLSKDPKASSNWIMGDLSGLLNSAGVKIQDSKVTPALLGELIRLIKEGGITGKIAKSVLPEVFETGKSPSRIVEEKGWEPISDSSKIETKIDQVIAGNQRSVLDYKGGKKNAIGFLVGQVMRATEGKANPQMVNQILREKLDAP